MAPSISSILTYASSLLQQRPWIEQVPIHHASPIITPAVALAPSCPIDSPLSCHNSTVAPDSCCFIYPGGQLLQTQFWDVYPSVGPVDSWTLHGLWPDLCDGSYPSYCHAAPRYHNITAVLTESNSLDLLNYMSTYWLPNRGSPESFWQHEWNKHGTCVNTLAPSCYERDESVMDSNQVGAKAETNAVAARPVQSGYQSGRELIDFLNRTVTLFSSLDTYAALAAHDIVPSTTRVYDLRAIEGALTQVTGQEVVVRCRYRKLTEVWYSFNVKGSLQTGDFVPAEPVGKQGRGGCPKRGIRYLPKRPTT